VVTPKTVTRERKSVFHTELLVLRSAGRKWPFFWLQWLQWLQSREPRQADSQAGQDKIQHKSGNYLSNFATTQMEIHGGTLWLSVAVTDESAP
jgi:hypothetical protein